MLLFLPAFTPAIAQLTGQSGEEVPGQVTVVRFEGNHHISSDELATVTTTKVTSFFQRALHGIAFLKLGANYQSLDNSKLERDTAALNAYYKDKGFLDARSSFRVTQDTADIHAYYEYIRQERLMQNVGKISPPEVHDTVTFVIQEGHPYTISYVAIEGLESLPNEFQPELTEKVTIKSGEQWSRKAAASEVDRLIGILIENGYPNAHEDSIVVRIQPSNHTVNILIYFRPGHRYRYGPVHIIYDTTSQEKHRVAENVIRAQLLIDSGHWYKLSEIQRSEANLNSLGTFDLFRIALDTDYINRIPDSLRDSAAVPVDVYLRMRITGEVNANVFGGVGAQGLVFGLGAGVIYGNALGAADKVDVEGSWQPFPTTQRRYGVNIDYFRPYIGLGRVPLTVGIGASRQDQFSTGDTSIIPYDDTSYTVHVGSRFILSKTDNKTTLTPDVLLAYIAAKATTTNTTILNLLPNLLPHKQINLLPSLSYQDDRTNDPLDPSGGDLLSSSVEWGATHRLLGQASSNYIKLIFQTKQYYDFNTHGNFILATRLQVGYTRLFDTSSADFFPALDHRFYGGGSTNRGWIQQTLVVSGNPGYSAILGGYNDFEFNLELRYAPFQYAQQFTSWQDISSAFRIVLFYDAGNVWDQMAQVDPHALNLDQIAQSIGLGLHYNTFFGTLRFDVGFKLYDPSGTFSSGYSPTTPASHGAWLFSSGHPSSNIYNINFGIGQAF